MVVKLKWEKCQQDELVCNNLLTITIYKSLNVSNAMVHLRWLDWQRKLFNFWSGAELKLSGITNWKCQLQSIDGLVVFDDNTCSDCTKIVLRCVLQRLLRCFFRILLIFLHSHPASVRHSFCANDFEERKLSRKKLRHKNQVLQRIWVTISWILVYHVQIEGCFVWFSQPCGQNIKSNKLIHCEWWR